MGGATAETSFKVISYNIRYASSSDRGARSWEKRKKKVTEYLVQNKPGVVGLQEVLHKQLLDVSKALHGYDHIGGGRSDGKTRGEYSPIFYHRKTWRSDPVEQGTFWLSDTPKVPNSKSWGNGITRICTWVRLIGNHGQALYVYNTHWDHRSQASREKAATLILKTIKSRKYKNDPVILLGDFNATTANPAIQKLLKSGYLVDHGKKQMSTFNAWKPGRLPGLRIDHIFTSRTLKRVSVLVEINGAPPASDHHPVISTVGF